MGPHAGRWISEMIPIASIGSAFILLTANGFASQVRPARLPHLVPHQAQPFGPRATKHSSSRVSDRTSRATGTSKATPRSFTGTELRWGPPTLTHATVVNVPSGQDPAVLNLDTSRDYIVALPLGGIHGTVEINGGHNVDLIGGEITVPSSANQVDNGADDTDTAIYVRDSTGTVHIEGVLIRADPHTKFDGIDVNAPHAVVQVENVRMEGVYGSMSSEHADVIQTWGGAQALEVDDLTATGDYQGLTIEPDVGTLGSAEIENVDLIDEAPPAILASTTVGGGIMVWLTAGTNTCLSAPVTFNRVYVADLTGRIEPANTVWPSTSSGLACRPVVSGNSVTWPDLPVDGAVTLGAPPSGPFVPHGVAGSAYSSPGYLAG